MARITAVRLVQHLELSGFVLVKELPAPAQSPPTAPQAMSGGKHRAHHLIVAVAGLALAADSARRNARVVDRDTVVTVSGKKVRLIDYNATKIRGECPRERDLAQRARALLQRLAGPGLELKRRGGDRYGRALEVAKALACGDPPVEMSRQPSSSPTWRIPVLVAGRAAEGVCRGASCSGLSRSELAEVASDWPAFEASSLVSRPGRRVARVVAGFDHDNLHTGLAYLGYGVLYQHPRHALPLVIGIDRKNIDLTHPVLRMQPRADPTQDRAFIDDYPRELAFHLQKGRDVGNLPDTPTIWVEGILNIGLHCRLKLLEHRCPSLQ